MLAPHCCNGSCRALSFDRRSLEECITAQFWGMMTALTYTHMWYIWLKNTAFKLLASENLHFFMNCLFRGFLLLKFKHALILSNSRYQQSVSNSWFCLEIYLVILAKANWVTLPMQVQYLTFSTTLRNLSCFQIFSIKKIVNLRIFQELRKTI